MRLQLKQEWTLGKPIGQGGFGSVLEATSEETADAVAKLIPKEPGAERELLFADLSGARNVVPILDSGETADSWVLVMPRATRSLRQHIESAQGRLPLHEALVILSDIATALTDLHNRVVHRDLKPENVLLLGGRWCLADFGISRYAEASTAPDTRKYMMTYQYAAPEQWREERATSATDVYALGIIGYELLAGNRPFRGPSTHNFRDQHLHNHPDPISGVPLAVAALVEECLYKAAQARPTPPNILARLARASETTPSAGLAQLQQANLSEVNRISEEARAASEAQSEEERREELAGSAGLALTRMTDYLKDAILANAPTASFQSHRRGGAGWNIMLNGATLKFTSPVTEQRYPWGQRSIPSIDVVASAELSVSVPENRQGYGGRSHSLWFCDAQTVGEYQWYETAFMDSPLMNRLSRTVDPYALSPGSEAAGAIGPGIMTVQVAWPFTPLSIDAIDDFVDRWAGWFAAAAQGSLWRPGTMPEKPTQGTWRQH
ncbi:serine/threonine-protein kinase [Micromonospora sp. NPDC005299]|uniref:serine/threonine-protein kinase n=1 Tax=Micromonospora sp. NPDC005299 TaxID=3364231 RepID=UPI00367A7CC3